MVLPMRPTGTLGRPHHTVKGHASCTEPHMVVRGLAVAVGSCPFRDLQTDRYVFWRKRPLDFVLCLHIELRQDNRPSFTLSFLLIVFFLFAHLCFLVPSFQPRLVRPWPFPFRIPPDVLVVSQAPPEVRSTPSLS